jgi:flavin-dependent dehydrogenase
MKSSYDVIVVGARCAGASAAMRLAQHGLSVLAIERARAGTDTLSTHALMRGGVALLQQWRVLEQIQAAGTPPVRAVQFDYGRESVRVPITGRDGVDALYAPRRTVLDPLLVRAATAAGADVRHGLRLVDLVRRRDGRVIGVVVEDLDRVRREIGATWVIGADGVDSTVARLTGAETYRTGSHAAAVIYGYANGLRLEGYRWSFGDRMSTGAIPTNDGAACVFVSLPREVFLAQLNLGVREMYHAGLRAAVPDILKAVHGARRLPLKAFAGRVGFFRRAAGPGWALIGDAGYFKDPITAHGITDALRDAELAAAAVAEGTDAALAGYAQTRDDLSMGLFAVTDEIAGFGWSMARLRDLHEALSREMRREADNLRQWTSPGCSTLTVAAIPAPSMPSSRSSTRTYGELPARS